MQILTLYQWVSKDGWMQRPGFLVKVDLILMRVITFGNDAHSDSEMTILELKFSILRHHCCMHGSVL